MDSHHMMERSLTFERNYSHLFIIRDMSSSNSRVHEEQPPTENRRYARPTAQMNRVIEQQPRRRDYFQNNDNSGRRGYNRHENNGNAQDVVRSHYNARPDLGYKKRQFSPIIQLKRFNNWIKSVLIQKFAPHASDHPILVLDMGCGKGGDLIKWDKAGIDGYIGIDIAEVSVNQAKKRYREMHASFDALFYAGDCFSSSINELLPPDQRQFDVVSLQFCMHYAFESEEKVRVLLENVSKCLPRGGVMIGTIPNSDVIVKHIKMLKPGEKEWGNDIYKVRFPESPPRSFRPPYGIQYYFYLEDAVTDVPEYVVPFEAFRAVAEGYNLELIWVKPFLDILNEEKNSETYGPLMDRMKVVDNEGHRGIGGQEKEAAGFYLAFAFEKRGI